MVLSESVEYEILKSGGLSNCWTCRNLVTESAGELLGNGTWNNLSRCNAVEKASRQWTHRGGVFCSAFKSPGTSFAKFTDEVVTDRSRSKKRINIQRRSYLGNVKCFFRRQYEDGQKLLALVEVYRLNQNPDESWPDKTPNAASKVKVFSVKDWTTLSVAFKAEKEKRNRKMFAFRKKKDGNISAGPRILKFTKIMTKRFHLITSFDTYNRYIKRFTTKVHVSGLCYYPCVLTLCSHIFPILYIFNRPNIFSL